MITLENVGLTHTHSQIRPKQIFGFSLIVMMLSFTSLNAQFVDPNTPDTYINCQSANVENTGTSILGDWQVSVMDGDYPSIVFYNHLTSAEDCHLLEGVRLGWKVSDPDVVWDYSTYEDIYVVYVAHADGYDGIWVERWKMDPFNAFIYLDASYFDFWGINGLAQVANVNSAIYPNIDIGMNKNSAVIWEDGGFIKVTTDIQNPAIFFTPNYIVNSFCTGYIAEGTEPDIAVGLADILSMTYKQLSSVNEIVVRQDGYGNIAAGSANLNCINTTMNIPPVHTDVGFPRISMPVINLANPADVHPQDCNVSYEVKTTGRNYIGTSTRREYLFQQWTTNIPPCDPNIVMSSLFNPWTHDIINTTGIGFATMNADLSADINDKPVSGYAGDLIYNGWSWKNVTGTRYNIGEVLAVALNNASAVNTTPFTNTPPFGCDTTYTYFTRTLTSWNDYSVVGEAWNRNDDQNIVSIGSDGTSMAFTFYANATSELIIKKVSIGTPALRGEKPKEVIESASTEILPKFYPNPSDGKITIASGKDMVELVITDITGRQILNQRDFVNPRSIELNLLSAGIFFAKLKSLDGNWYTAKLVVK